MDESCRILVVDDEPRGVELLVRALRSLGGVETAASSEAGWQIAARGGLDLVISDQRMPGMSGVELLTRVAEQSEHTGRILLTGYADLESSIDAINRGRVHAYLTKPCSPGDLTLTARSVLERVRLARENEQLVRDLSEKATKLEQTLASLEEAQQRVVDSERLAAIGRMIAMIVHDLRGPLSVIRSSAGELLRDEPDPDAPSPRELAGEILAEGERMQRMCSELLEATRASEASATPARDEDLDEVVAAALAKASHNASQAGVRLETELASTARLPLDEDRLRRALLNLVFNAVEAMPEGGLLRVVTRRNGARATLSVIDNGPGIPEEIGDRLFEPFVTAGKRGGSGLGLAVVKKVVEDHGGSVEVGKPEGGGTVFHLHFPLAAG